MPLSFGDIVPSSAVPDTDVDMPSSAAAEQPISHNTVAAEPVADDVAAEEPVSTSEDRGSSSDAAGDKHASRPAVSSEGSAGNSEATATLNSNTSEPAGDESIIQAVEQPEKPEPSSGTQ